MIPITPKVREALWLIVHARTQRLVRARGGYGRADEPQAGLVTRRTANALRDDGLVEFDDPLFPTQITLTPLGVSTADAALAPKLDTGAA